MANNLQLALREDQLKVFLPETLHASPAHLVKMHAERLINFDGAVIGLNMGDAGGPQAFRRAGNWLGQRPVPGCLMPAHRHLR